MADGSEGGPRAKRRGVLGDPLSWTEADKCLLVVAIVLPGTGFFMLMGHAFNGWLYMPPDVDPSVSSLINRLTYLSAAGWGLLLVIGVLIRRRWPSNKLYVLVTTQLYALTIGVFVCLSGAFHSPGWILFLGGAVVGFLVFGRVYAWLAVVTFAVVFAGFLVLSEAGWFGDLALATRPPPMGGSDWRWWLVRMGVSTAVFGSLTLALCAYVISLLREREAQLDAMAKTDALTGVNNRRHFMDLMTAEFARVSRYDTPLSCVMIDLDHFKAVNDLYGHLAGDRMLVGVADAIARSVRDTDSVARYGGEEFVLLLPNTDAEGARELAERCRGLIASTVVADDGHELSVTASMGIASFPGSGAASVDDLLHSADQALYAAKGQGRDRVVVAGDRT